MDTNVHYPKVVQRFDSLCEPFLELLIVMLLNENATTREILIERLADRLRDATHH